MLIKSFWVHVCWGILIFGIILKEPKHTKNDVTVPQQPDHDSLQQPFKNHDSAPDHAPTKSIPSLNDAKSSKPPQQPLLPEFKQIIGDSTLHYIGVYQSNAREYTNEEQDTRRQECDKQNADSSSQNAKDCWDYAYRAEKLNVENTVTVHINSNKAVSLILTSYEPVKWVIKGNTHNLKLVYLSGYNQSDISRHFRKPTQVYSSFYNSNACSSCSPSSLDYFYGYELNSELQRNIQRDFGKALNSFQGGYRAKSFNIN